MRYAAASSKTHWATADAQAHCRLIVAMRILLNEKRL